MTDRATLMSQYVDLKIQAINLIRTFNTMDVNDLNYQSTSEQVDLLNQQVTDALTQLQ